LGGEEGEEAEGGKELPGGWVEGLRDGARAHRAAGLTMLEQQESQLCDSEARSQAHTVSPLHLQRHKIVWTSAYGALARARARYCTANMPAPSTDKGL
jgi:hypothetical protein